MKTKTTKREPTAAEAYTKTNSDIAMLIDILQAELERNASEHSADPKNWGLVGNIQKVRDDLAWTVAFISGREREQVEEFLADAI